MVIQWSLMKNICFESEFTFQLIEKTLGLSQEKSYHDRRLKLEVTSPKICVMRGQWQYRLWSFQGKDKKLERLMAKNQV